MQIFGLLGSWLGYILWGVFYLIKDFGLSIIVFTIIVKLVMFPFSVKQQKSMAGTAKLSKKQRELQEKYKNNREKLQEEMNKLYEKEGVKPMGGCLTSIIPMLVILGLFYAVAYPLTNTLHLNSEAVNNAVSYINTIPGYVPNENATYQQINLLTIFHNIEGTSTIQGLFNASEISKINMFAEGFNTFGMNLFAVPKSYGLFSWYTLFPVLNLVVNIGYQFIMSRMNKQMQQQQGCMKVMLYAMPLFSAYIAYTVPCAVAFYWIASSLISLVQSIVLQKIFSTEQITANSEARHAALMFENEAKIPYVYAPHEFAKESNVNTKKKKK